MAKYKVKVLAHQLKNNVVAKFGEVVDESQLVYNVNELVAQGFIEEVKASKDIDVKEVEEVKASKSKK